MMQIGFKKQGGVSAKQNVKRPGTLAAGVLSSLLIMLAFTALEASMAQRLVIPVKLASGLGVVIWSLSSFLGSYICAKTAGQGTLVAALLCGSVYGILLLVLTGFLFKAQFEGVLKGVAIILASSAAAGVLASGRRKTATKKVRFR